MKKIICILLSLIVMGSASFAQNADAKKPTANPRNSTNRVPPPGMPPSAQAASSKNASQPTQTKVKKDGTPDMRHKVNKEAVTARPATGKMKKDGTPDMRYKENKQAVKKN